MTKNLLNRGISAAFVAFILLASLAPAWAGFTDYPGVKLQMLDKSTARTITREAKVGETIEYGSLFIRVQACRKSDPLDKPESASFLQIWEVPIDSDQSEWVFSGWMFASSPALSAMDHAVYDAWVLDCTGEALARAEPVVEVEEEAVAVEEVEMEEVVIEESDDALKRVIDNSLIEPESGIVVEQEPDNTINYSD